MTQSILHQIVASKVQEVARAKKNVSESELRDQISSAAAPRDFLGALRSFDGVSLIAEVKKASPSAGVIREDFDPIEIAKTYVQGGAQCISVLTDAPFFQGRLDYLSAIRAAIDVPLLRKDFVIDPYQVFEARAAGADAVLLIAECLQPAQMFDLHSAIVDLGMVPLVELYEEKNLPAVLDCKPRLIGVNNRDLNTFKVDLKHSIRLRRLVPLEIVFVSESGIRTSADVQLLAENNIDAMLVGESLTRERDILGAMNSLRPFH